VSDKIYLILSEAELGLLEKVLFLEPGLQDVTETARPHPKGFLVGFTETNITEALDALSYAVINIAKSAQEKDDYMNLHNKIKQGFIRNQNLRRSIGE